MKRLLLSALYRESEFYADKDVVVAGWIRTIRDSKVCLLYTSPSPRDA